MATEREIKLAPKEDLEEVRKKLRKLGFRVAKKRVFEANDLFDTPGQNLRQAGKLIRIRTVGDESILTYKGPNQPGKHKQREEIETHLSDGDAFQQVLQRLGYEPTFRYEKFRTEYAKRGEHGVVTTDETPIGDFLEIEGPARWIDSTAKALGFKPAEYILDSYAALYQKYAESKGVKPTNMVFPGKRKKA